MAWYSVNHSCGHTAQHQLYGPGKGRESKARWLGTVPCPDCRAEAERAARAEEVRKAAEWAANNGLPALTGTPKQVAWAESIRRAILRDMLTVATDPNYLTGIGPRLGQVWPDYVAWVTGQSEARWWIDHRELSPAETLLAAKDGLIPMGDAFRGALSGTGARTPWQYLFGKWLDSNHPALIAAINADATEK